MATDHRLDQLAATEEKMDHLPPPTVIDNDSRLPRRANSVEWSANDDHAGLEPAINSLEEL